MENSENPGKPLDLRAVTPRTFYHFSREKNRNDKCDKLIWQEHTKKMKRLNVIITCASQSNERNSENPGKPLWLHGQYRGKIFWNYKYYSSHCLEVKNIHGSPGSAYVPEKIQFTVYKVCHIKGYRLACPRLPHPIHQHHGKNLECGSWTPTACQRGNQMFPT